MMQPRRTKIIATLGPSIESEEVLRQLITVGVNIFRLNFSHGTIDKHKENILKIRQLASEMGKIIGILVDLQGPKIRIKSFKDHSVVLQEGENFTIDATLQKGMGDNQQVGLDYPELIHDLKVQDELLLDDGRIVLAVTEIDFLSQKIHCRVIHGGKLSDHKGLNRKGGGLSAPSLTTKDIQDIEALKDLPVDFVAISFPKNAQDILQLRKRLTQIGSLAQVVAKIERCEAVENIDEILVAADAIMIARGDLGVEIGYAELPGVQKALIARAETFDKAVIVATQMMESMISNPIPTRAEVSDVANAVLDGTDAVMLSAETATGEYPIEVVLSLNAICLAAEQNKIARHSAHRISTKFERPDSAIALAAMYVANHLEIKAIVALTESGSTPIWMSRIRSGIPIYALSRHPQSCNRMTLYRGVYPVKFDITQYKMWEISHQAVLTLKKLGVLVEDDKVLLTKGHVIGVGGKTNTLKILTVPKDDKYIN